MRPVSTTRAFLLSLCLAAACAADPPASTPAPTPAPYSVITDAEIAAISFDEVPEDNGWVTPLTDGLGHLPEERRKDFDEWLAKLDAWEPGKIADPAQRTRNLLAVASMCDIGHGEFEGEAAYGIFERLKKDILPDQLKKICAWIYLHPDQGTVVAQADGLGVDGTFPEDLVRERIGLYAQKLLGRLLGKLPYVPPADPATPDKEKSATPDKDKPAVPEAAKPAAPAKPASPAAPAANAPTVTPAGK